MNRVFLLVFFVAGCALTHKRGPNVEAVIEAYRREKSETEECYKKGLQENATIQGKVWLSWKVGLEGKALDAKILRSELANATVENCLIAHLNRLSFPKQARFSPALVEFELDFSRRSKSL